MYRDGDIIAVYTLDRPGHGSLAGCADACLLNWRMTADTTQALDTDCSVESHCPMASGTLVADRKCEAFMFNRQTGVCTLLSAERSMRLTRSSNFWSGKLICEDVSSVDDWAEGVVSRRSPPPPPPPTFYLAPNGVTVTCRLANNGDTGVVNGITYTKRSRADILPLIGTNASLLATTCTSGMTSMEQMFDGQRDPSAQTFNEDISSWDTSAVTDMYKAFNHAFLFNQDLSSWDGSALTDGGCSDFANSATAWLAAYSGTIARTPPISPSMIAAGCGP